MTKNTQARSLKPKRKLAFRWLRIAVTFAAFAFIFARAPFSEVMAAFAAVSPEALLHAVLLVFASMCLGALRWRALLRAYGAIQVPRYRRLLQLYFVGLFYNTFIPGAIGGDVVRGVASREAFGDDPLASTTGGLSVVFVERVCGVVALLLISAGAFMFRPIEAVEDLWLWAPLGVGVAVAAILALAIAPKLSGRFPRGVRRLMASVPELRRAWPLCAALLLSVGVQVANVLAGHAVVSSLAPSVTLADSAVVMPLIGASAFFPLTVSGAGVRELAFAALYHTVGVLEVTAYAASLSLWAAQLAVATVGGVLTLVTPIRAAAASADA